MDSEKNLSTSNWREFTEYLKTENSFVLTSKWQSFVDALRKSAKLHVLEKKSDTSLYRARIHRESTWGNAEDIRPYAGSEISAPPSSETEAGRVNSEGIPCLYLSESEETALAEARPWRKSQVTVAKFHLRYPVKVVDLISVVDKVIDGQIDATEEDLMWVIIALNFSRPVSPFEPAVSYLPTQYLASIFKRDGLDGIRYPSAMDSDGVNYAIFNTKAATDAENKLYQIKAIKYEKQQTYPKPQKQSIAAALAAK